LSKLNRSNCTVVCQSQFVLASTGRRHYALVRDAVPVRDPPFGSYQGLKCDQLRITVGARPGESLLQALRAMLFSN
jgi:hypothetical protein